MKGNLIYDGKIFNRMGLIIGALEDNDDNDDTATGKCRWVLSIKD